MIHRRAILPTLVILIAVAIPQASMAQQSYSEDFGTTTYKDEVHTTADWDTAAGELKLPTLPSFIGSYATQSSATSVAVAGDLAFVAAYARGLQVIDISDPGSPVFVDSYINAFGSAKDVVVEGDLAFVAYDGLGLLIIDISDPTDIRTEGSYDTPYQASGVAVSGDHAFVADLAGGLQIIDVSDPANPVFAGSYATPGYPTGVAVAGDLAYVSDGPTLQVIDVTDPTNPGFVASYSVASGVYDATIAGDFAYLAAYDGGLEVLDITDPTNPGLVGSYDTPGNARHVAVSGDLAFVADDYYGGLQVIDIGDPSSPVLVASYETPGSAMCVMIAGDHAYIADGGSGLQIVRVRNFVDPQLVGSYDTPGVAMEITLAGNLAFIADATSLQVIDISDPANPTFAGSALPQSSTRDVAVAGNYAFTAEGAAGLQVLDISDPANPTFASDFNPLGFDYCRGIAVAGNYAFLADDLTGLLVIDISDPTLTQYGGVCDTPGNAYAVAIEGDHAFVADYNSGLQVLDITDPSSPAIVGSYDTSGRAIDVAIAGDVAFVADYYDGLQVLDISDPSNPVLIGNYDTPNVAEDVKIVGDLAFVTDWTAGLLVLDISEPASPVLVGGYDTATTAWSVAVAGDHAYVTDELWGLQVLEVFDHLGMAASAVGQSLAVDGASDAIPRARLSSTETAGVTWELSANASANWTTFTPDDAWRRVTIPGDDLIWRSTHTFQGAGNPTVSDLAIDWLNEFGPIATITDVPDDQGGWVRLNFTRSGYDFADESILPITGYGTYRRVDDTQRCMRILSAPSSATIEETALSSFAPDQVRQLDGRFYVVRGEADGGDDRGEFPAGVWEFISFHPALQQDSYLSLVPTVADSTVQDGIRWSVFLTTAHSSSPSIWFASYPDSGYSVDNIAPGVPVGFRVDHDYTDGPSLIWSVSSDEDFQYFRVYRGDSEEFEIGPETLVHETAETNWLDSEGGPSHFYQLTALDHAGNESDPALPYQVTGVESNLPTAFELRQNLPNPFNPTTTIYFELPRSGAVRLEIYDVTGRLVTTLLEGVLDAGRHEAVWRAGDEGGKALGSGLYFYRLSASGETETRKMLLLK